MAALRGSWARRGLSRGRQATGAPADAGPAAAAGMWACMPLRTVQQRSGAAAPAGTAAEGMLAAGRPAVGSLAAAGHRQAGHWHTAQAVRNAATLPPCNAESKSCNFNSFMFMSKATDCQCIPLGAHSMLLWVGRAGVAWGQLLEAMGCLVLDARLHHLNRLPLTLRPGQYIRGKEAMPGVVQLLQRNASLRCCVPYPAVHLQGLAGDGVQYLCTTAALCSCSLRRETHLWQAAGEKRCVRQAYVLHYAI